MVIISSKIFRKFYSLKFIHWRFMNDNSWMLIHKIWILFAQLLYQVHFTYFPIPLCQMVQVTIWLFCSIHFTWLLSSLCQITESTLLNSQVHVAKSALPRYQFHINKAELIRHPWYSSSALPEILPSGPQIFLYPLTLTFPSFCSFLFHFLPRLLTNKLKNQKLQKNTFSLNSKKWHLDFLTPN